MLDNLRASAHGIFGKILLGLLVLSFGIWGIGDIFRSGTAGSNVVATVGRTVISAQEFHRVLRERQEEMQKRLGKAYTPELMRKLGLDKMVRDDLIGNALIVNEAEALGIVVSDDELAKLITSNPAFEDEKGNFDKAIYLAALRNHGISEQRYVDNIRKNIAAKMLVDTIASSVVVPDDLLHAVYRSREEQRQASLFLISASALPQVPQPSQKEIAAYYEEHAKSFMTPEYRSLSYADLKLSDLESRIDISEEEIKQAYNDRIQDFHKAEQRVVEQLVFEKESDAKKAAEKLAQGDAFSDVKKTANITNKDKTSLGTIGKQDLPAQESAAVFALKEGQASKPLQSDFGWHVFYVSRIIPEATLPLAQAREEIIRELSASKAGETLSRLANQLQDDMAGGMPLEEAVKKAGFKVASVKQITREGKTISGEKAAIPGYDSFLNTAFSTGEKENSQAVQAQDGSYFIVRVDAITPEHVQPLAEVRERIVTTLTAEKTQMLLKKTADETAEKLRGGEKSGIALTELSSGSIKRNATDIEEGKTKLPHALVLELFSLSTDEYTHAYEAAGGGYMIAKVERIIPAPASADSKLLEKIGEELKQSLSNEAVEDYYNYLRGKYRISVNERLFSAVAKTEGEE